MHRHDLPCQSPVVARMRRRPRDHVHASVEQCACGGARWLRSRPRRGHGFASPPPPLRQPGRTPRGSALKLGAWGTRAVPGRQWGGGGWSPAVTVAVPGGGQQGPCPALFKAHADHVLLIGWNSIWDVGCLHSLYQNSCTMLYLRKLGPTRNNIVTSSPLFCRGQGIRCVMKCWLYVCKLARIHQRVCSF
jgi:hypothetical protein